MIAPIVSGLNCLGIVLCWLWYSVICQRYSAGGSAVAVILRLFIYLPVRGAMNLATYPSPSLFKAISSKFGLPDSVG